MDMLSAKAKKIGALLVLACGLWAVGAAFPQSEPNDGLITEGRTIFEKTAGGVGCAACHGHFAMGDLKIGPNIRGASPERIQGGLAARDAMAFIRLTDEELTAVAAFLGYLGKLLPVKITMRDSQFEPNRVTVPANREIQFLLDNKGNETCSFSSNEAGIKEKSLEPGKVGDIVWRTSSKQDTFTARCNPRPNMILTIVVGTEDSDAEQ